MTRKENNREGSNANAPPVNSIATTHLDKKPARRKLSVVESRRFSIADVFRLSRQHSHSNVLSDKRKHDDDELSNASTNAAATAIPRIIEDRIDVTPRPLISNKLPSVDNISFSDDNGPGRVGDDKILTVDDASMKWIPELLVQLAKDEAKKKEPSQDEIPLFTLGAKQKYEETKGSEEKKHGEEEHHQAFSIKSTIALSSSVPSGSNNSSSVETFKGEDEIQLPSTLEHHCQTEPIATVSSSTQADQKHTSNFSMSTVQYTIAEENDEDKVEEIVSAIMATNESLLDVSLSEAYQYNSNQQSRPHLPIITSTSGQVTFDEIRLQQIRRKIFQSKAALDKLRILELAVQQNAFYIQQTKYRGVPLPPGQPANSITSEKVNETYAAEKRPTLEKLFDFKCPQSAGKIVTCMKWHKVNKDILAVGYAGSRQDFASGSSVKGCIMMWSLRNPSFPEHKIEMHGPVTALAFSRQTPTILAVGMDDGCISITNTSLHDCASLNIDTASTTGRHMSTVTDLIWIEDKNQNFGERLISISTDGRVLQWTVKKGMGLQPLMTLKRNSMTVETSSSPFFKNHQLPNIAMGLCIDFKQSGGDYDDSIIYVAGTNDGTLLSCSRALSEKPLYSKKAHDGPITNVTFSPFDSNLILSCSADSTVKIWSMPKNNKHDNLKEDAVIYPTNLIAPINDAAWSPCVPTMFALVSGDGRLEIWDIGKSKLDPITDIKSKSQIMSGNEKTVVLFSDNNRIFVGDEKGSVEVYRLVDNTVKINSDGN